MTNWDNLKPYRPVVKIDEYDIILNSENEKIHVTIEEQLKPKTHTPEGGRQVNDKVYLYYECVDCHDTLDPNTTRFAELNNHAMIKDWYIQWGEHGYDPYCPKCYPKHGFKNG